MNTSAHVSLDSTTKLRNLMIATEAVINQLRSEGRHSSVDELRTALRYMRRAADFYTLTDAPEGAPND